MKPTLVICVLLLVPFVYAQEKAQMPATGAQPPKAARAADFRAGVQKMADEWKAAFQNKDADTVAKMYTEDALFINPEGTYHGVAEIKAQLKKMIDRSDTTDDITTTKAVRSGNLAYAEGTYAGKVPSASGAEEQTHGSWVVTLKNVDGKWMLASHTSLSGGALRRKAAGAKKAK